MLALIKGGKVVVFCNIFLEFEIKVERNLKPTNKIQFLKYVSPLKKCEMLVCMHIYLYNVFYFKTYGMDTLVLAKSPLKKET